MNVCGIGLILLFVMINKIPHQWGKFVSLEKKIKNNSVSLRFNDTYTALPSWKKILFSLTAWLKSFTKWGYDALGILKYVSVCILLRDRLSVISREYLPTYWPYWEKGLCNWKLKYNSFKNFLFCKWMY